MEADKHSGDATLSPPNLVWLDAFRAQHGRAPRILHIGNIANNAYNCSRALRSLGFESDVICYDYYHVMGCPEWEEVSIDLAQIDQNRPDWLSVDLKGYQRPRWFAQGPMQETLAYLDAKYGADEARSERLWMQLLVHCRLMRERDLPALIENSEHDDSEPSQESATETSRQVNDVLVAGLGAIRAVFGRGARAFVSLRPVEMACNAFFRDSSRMVLGAFVERKLTEFSMPRGAAHSLGTMIATLCTLPYRALVDCRNRLAALAPPPMVTPDTVGAATLPTELPSKPPPDLFLARCRSLLGWFARTFPNRPDKLTEFDFASYRGILPLWKKVITQYDCVIGYSTDGIYPLLADGPPYVAFEHGTIRDIPWQPDLQGRLATLVYAAADATYLTNADSIQHARNLNCRNTVFGLHGFNPDRFDFAKHPSVRGVRRRASTHCKFLAPARHHWKHGFASWLKGNDQIIKAVDLVRKERPDKFTVTLVEWGAEVDETRRLIEDLCLEDYFEWISPLPKSELLRQYELHDCVIDQFVLPCIGSVTLDAVALGMPVITALDTAAMQEFYGETLPLLNCRDYEQISRAMGEVMDRSASVERSVIDAYDWFVLHHNHSVLTDKLVEAIRLATNSRTSHESKYPI